MIILDYRDRRPIYEQVISRFQELMLTGALEKDSQLPSVRIYLFHQGKRKLCGGQRPCEGSRETGSAAAAGGSGQGSLCPGGDEGAAVGADRQDL